MVDKCPTCDGDGYVTQEHDFCSEQIGCPHCMGTGRKSDTMRSQFDCTPEQYHAGLDKLWAALGVSGPQEHDVFTLVAAEIEQLRRLNQDKFNHLQAYCRAASIDKRKIQLLHDATIILRNDSVGREEATRLIDEASKL